MNTSHSILRDLMVVALTIFGFVSVSYAGGAATGGGSVCTNPAVNNGHPILLDLALSNSADLIDTPYTGTRLHSDNVAETIGANFVALHQKRAYKFALAKIEAWERDPKSRDSAYLVALGLKNIQFMITPNKIRQLSRVYLPPQSKCQARNLQTAILFDRGVLYISLPVWNELGLLSQAGLLIHEALRNVQLFERLDGTDADLERLTLEILLGPDRNFGRTDLNAEPFFAKYISSGESGDLVHKDCLQLRAAQAKYPLLKKYLSNSYVNIICTADLTPLGDEVKVRDTTGLLANELDNAYRATGYDYHYDDFPKLVSQLRDTFDCLTTDVVGQAIDRGEDFTIPLRVSQLTVAFDVVQKYLRGEPLSNSPSAEARLDQKTRQFIKYEQTYFAQLFSEN